MSEIGGPVAVPDILVELRQPLKPLHFIQITAARFLTRKVEEEFERQRQTDQVQTYGWIKNPGPGDRTGDSANNV